MCAKLQKIAQKNVIFIVFLTMLNSYFFHINIRFPFLLTTEDTKNTDMLACARFAFHINVR